MVFAASEFAVQYLGETANVPVSSWIFEKDRSNGFYDYEMGAGILDWFVKTVAPYPWAKLANVQSRTRYGGMENASCIFYAEGSVTGTRSCEALMAHEIAHQWFGNSASEANWHHIWLSEGFATYFTDLYFEQVHDQDTFKHRMQLERQQVVSWKPTWKYAVVDPSITNLNNLLNRNSYQKGAWILHMLRHELGDKNFMSGIKAYYQDFKFGNAFTEDLQKAFEKSGNTNLESFFKQWLYRPGHPQLELSYKWKKGKQAVELNLKQVNEGAPFSFPLDIVLEFEGNQTIKKTFQVKDKNSKFSIPANQLPKKVTMDPEVWLLFEGKVLVK